VIEVDARQQDIASYLLRPALQPSHGFPKRTLVHYEFSKYHPHRSPVWVAAGLSIRQVFTGVHRTVTGKLTNPRNTLLTALTGSPTSNRDTRRAKAVINAVISSRARCMPAQM
jgi:hypothetical protein